MGKQTLFHPIPLSVLRGSLEFCGWEFKKLKQVFLRSKPKEAVYKIEGLKPPKDSPRLDPFGAQHALQKCFMPTVYVERVAMDSNGKVEAWIAVGGPKHVQEAEGTPATTADIPF